MKTEVIELKTYNVVQNGIVHYSLPKFDDKIATFIIFTHQHQITHIASSWSM